MRLNIIIYLTLNCLIFLCLNCNSKPQHKVITLQEKKEHALNLLEDVGGIYQINEEARQLLDQYNLKNNRIHILHFPELSKYSGIARLGNARIIYSQTPNIPEYIKIRFGTRDYYKYFHVFHPDEPNKISQNPKFIELTPNIFLLWKADYL